MDSPKKQASKILRDKKMYQRWLAIFMCLALVVTSGTLTALKLTGQAMTAKQLQCSYVPHEHTDECYNDEGELICGLSDKVVHTHDSSCYDAEGNIVCTLEELEPHEHDESCYTEVKELICGQQEHEAIPAHHHTEECYTTETVEEPVLSCGLEETDGVPAIEAAPGHVHTDACYTTETVEVTPAGVDEEGNEIPAVTEERRTLTCGMAEGEGAVEGQPEIPAHHHTEECYTTQTTETQVLTCGLEEHDEEIPAHFHTDECYTTTRELTCGKDEAILHTHTDDCYDIELDEDGNEISRTLTCELLQLEAHQHGDGCFVEVPVDEIIPAEKPEEELPVAAVVYCGKQEHTHTDACYQQDENGEFVLNENGEKILTCELEEHTHTEECFVEPELEGELLTATKTVGDVTVTVEYSEDANIPEEAELDFFEYDKDSEEYAQYQEQVEGRMDRLFDIGFYLDGEKIEPAEGAIVKVNITYPGMEEKRQTVAHFTEDGPVSLGTQTTIDGESTIVEFYTDSFSPFALMDDSHDIYLTVGESVTLTAALTSLDGYEADDTKWKIKDETGSIDEKDGKNYVGVPESEGRLSTTITALQPTGDSYVLVRFKAEKTKGGEHIECFRIHVIDLKIEGPTEVLVDNTIALTLTGVPSNVGNVTWEYKGVGSNAGEIEITNGTKTGATIKGVKEGPVKITASYTKNGKTVSATHTVWVKTTSGGGNPGGGVVNEGSLNVDKYILDKYQDGTYDLNLTFNASLGNETYIPMVDVVFVVDASSSMNTTDNDQTKTRWELVKPSVEAAVEQLKASDTAGNVDARYAIVKFNATGWVHAGWRDAQQGYDDLGGIIRGTNYEGALKRAAELLGEARPGAERVLIFLTDGEPWHWDGLEDLDEGTVEGATVYAVNQFKKMTNLIDRFYSIAFPFDEKHIPDALNQMKDVCVNEGIACSIQGASGSDLDALLKDLVKTVTEVACSNVVSTDVLQPYVSLEPNGLTVSIVDKDGKLIQDVDLTGNDGKSNSVTIKYTYKDKDGQEHTGMTYFKAVSNGQTITGKFVTDPNGDTQDPNYTLNNEWTYKINAHVRLNVVNDDEYDEGAPTTKTGDFIGLNPGVFTNIGDNKVTGNFSDKEVSAVFPKPVVPQARELTITKVDADKTNTKLTGAVFTLTQDGKQVGETVTTDKDGKATIKGIRTGTYILAETKAPDGYTTPDEKDTLRITVNEDGSVSFAPTLAESKVWSRTTLSAAAKDPATMTVKNESAGVPVEIIKKGVKGVDLKGIDFTIGEENRQISEGVANPESGVIIYGDQNENLPIGITEITEILPTGSQYQTIKPVYVEVEKDDNATATGGYEVTIVADVKGTPLTEEQSKACAATAAYDQTKGKWVVTIQNTLAPITGVEIFKTTYGATGDNAGLSDAKFDLYVAPNGEDYSTELTRVASDLTTGKNGKIAITSAGFAGFEADKTYYLVETKAPAGYVAGGEPIKITVKVNGEGVAEINATTKTNNNGDTVKVTGKTITVYNSAGVELPHTGGIGTQLFTVGGGLLMVLAAGLYFWNKRRISEM